MQRIHYSILYRDNSMSWQFLLLIWVYFRNKIMIQLRLVTCQQVSVVKKVFITAIILCISAPIDGPTIASALQRAAIRSRTFSNRQPNTWHGHCIQPTIRPDASRDHIYAAAGYLYDRDRTLTATITDPDGVPTSGTSCPYCITGSI